MFGAVLVGLLVALYLKPGFRSDRIKQLSDYLYTRLAPALLAPVFYLAAKAMLWLNETFLRAGRLEAPLGSERSPRSGDAD